MTVTRTTGYGISITRDPKHEGWVRVALRKHFWAVDAGSRSRPVAETGFWSQGMNEREILEGALRDLLRTVVDDLDRG